METENSAFILSIITTLIFIGVEIYSGGFTRSLIELIPTYILFLHLFFIVWMCMILLYTEIQFTDMR